MEKSKKIYAVYWSGENQENYLSLTDAEYENIMKVLEVLEPYGAELKELEVKEF